MTSNKKKKTIFSFCNVLLRIFSFIEVYKLKFNVGLKVYIKYLNMIFYLFIR